MLLRAALEKNMWTGKSADFHELGTGNWKEFLFLQKKYARETCSGEAEDRVGVFIFLPFSTRAICIGKGIRVFVVSKCD